MEDEEVIRIWTDGSCINNPGPGGWAYIKTYKGKEIVGKGNCPAITHNIQMEMVAVIQALRSLKRRDIPTIVHTDCQMIVKGMTEWLDGWIARGWRKGVGKPVADVPLWEALRELRDDRAPEAPVTFVWIRGHSGDPMNERADELAEAQARKAARVAAAAMEVVFDPERGLMVPLFEAQRGGESDVLTRSMSGVPL